MEKKYNVAIYLNAFIVCLGLVCQIILVTRPAQIVFTLMGIAMYLLICFYAFVGYKKPHGNLLRYLMLAYTIVLLLNIYFGLLEGFDDLTVTLYAAAAALVAYMAGRLNKIKQNRFIAVIALLLLCHCSHAAIVTVETLSGITFDFISRISIYEPAFLWVALSSAYFTRFLQHKEAGLTDK